MVYLRPMYVCKISKIFTLHHSTFVVKILFPCYKLLTKKDETLVFGPIFVEKNTTKFVLLCLHLFSLKQTQNFFVFVFFDKNVTKH